MLRLPGKKTYNKLMVKSHTLKMMKLKFIMMMTASKFKMLLMMIMEQMNRIR